MRFPIYGKIKNGNQTTNQVVFLRVTHDAFGTQQLLFLCCAGYLRGNPWDFHDQPACGSTGANLGNRKANRFNRWLAPVGLGQGFSWSCTDQWSTNVCRPIDIVMQLWKRTYLVISVGSKKQVKPLQDLKILLCWTGDCSDLPFKPDFVPWKLHGFHLVWSHGSGAKNKLVC